MDDRLPPQGGVPPTGGRSPHGGLPAEALTLRDLARFCSEDLLSKIDLKKLRLPLKHMWVAAKGAREYREAVAEGDIAAEEDAALRIHGPRGCENCPSMTMTGAEVKGAPVVAEGGQVIKCWCGPELEEHPEAIVNGRAAPTCGCLVALKVNGKMIPAGRTVVASKYCWQRRWGEVKRVGEVEVRV